MADRVRVLSKIRFLHLRGELDRQTIAQLDRVDRALSIALDLAGQE